MLITSQFPANATSNTKYEAGKSALDAGAIPTENMTSACASVKFRWALAQAKSDNSNKLQITRDIMNKNYIGEFDD